MPAKGYEDTHEVSSCGRKVRSNRTGRCLHPTSGSGRVLMRLPDGRRRWENMHDLLPAEIEGAGDESTVPSQQRVVRVLLVLTRLLLTVLAAVLASILASILVELYLPGLQDATLDEASRVMAGASRVMAGAYRVARAGGALLDPVTPP